MGRFMRKLRTRLEAFYAIINVYRPSGQCDLDE